MNRISITELKTLLNDESKLKLIDVRSPAEFRAQHVEAASNLPLDVIDEESLSQLAEKGDFIYLICQSGARSQKAAERIEALGYSNVFSVDGGTAEWVSKGLPVSEGQGVMSIERQVRIAAGSIVVLGVAMSLMVHPGFVFLAGFVGAGLVFAGVTDTCGMGLLLAKMPWNR